jgi:hypothetical protein
VLLVGAAAGATWAAEEAAPIAKITAEQPKRHTSKGDAKIWDELEGLAESVRITLGTFLSPAQKHRLAVGRMHTAVRQ